jgi:hypothetical protein
VRISPVSATTNGFASPSSRAASPPSSKPLTGTPMTMANNASGGRAWVSSPASAAGSAKATCATSTSAPTTAPRHNASERDT